jgi:hypothetical protein
MRETIIGSKMNGIEDVRRRFGSFGEKEVKEACKRYGITYEKEETRD